MNLRTIMLGCFICTLANSQGLQELLQVDDAIAIDPETIKSIDDFVLRLKPWWLKAVTKEWQWVAIDPNIYYPHYLDPLKYPAIIEHEKVHLFQQRNKGKYEWLFKYIVSKKFRFNQEMEPIVVELSNMPPEARMRIAIKYAHHLSGAPYLKAAKSYDLALDGILSKAKEMGVSVE